MPDVYSSFGDLLGRQAAEYSSRTALRFLENGETEAERLTYAELERDARAIAVLVGARASRGDRALLLYPPGLDFVRAFMGCLLAGVVAVPVYLPRRNRSIERLRAVSADAQAAVALTSTAGLQSLAREQVEELGTPLVVADSSTAQEPDAWRPGSLDRTDLAFLQYTSGSTGTPKGVMITHGNLLHNCELIKQGFSHSTDSVFVSWLPVFHDMGLVGMILESIYCGSRSVLMAPAAFLQRPTRWLRAVSDYQGTTSGGPNSAYELCIQKVSDEDLAGLDLASWENAYNGAEPVRASTVRRFYERFASCGLRLDSIQPCYGLAEGTLLVSVGGRGQSPIVETGAEGATFVSSGRLWFDERVLIVDPETNERCSEGEKGEVWVASGSIGAGYWKRPAETEATFGGRTVPDDSGPFLRTGDLGYVRSGQLFIAGRLKDLIIIRGRNVYPQDLEYTAGAAHVALNPDLTAAFSVDSTGQREEEELVLVCEVARQGFAKLDVDDVLQAVRQAITEEHEVEPAAIVLLRPLRLPRTSSGKIQRRACRNRFLEGTLEAVGDWRRRRAADPAEKAPELTGQVPSYKEICDWLVVRFAQQTGLAAERIGVEDPFSRYGIDSQRAVVLSGELQDWLGRPLPETVAYDYPSIAALARYLSDGTAFSGGLVRVQRRVATSHTEPIAITGIAFRLPGAATPETFWESLVGGVDSVGSAPVSRFRAKSLGVAGFLQNIETFDAEFFALTPREAERMDPQQRLLLEVAWESLENAGVRAERLAGSRTGVFVGMSHSDYVGLQAGRGEATDPYVGTGNALSIAANRLSYFFDLRGPSWTVDTACSSSLVALHQACGSLRRGECDAALCGGANLILAPQLTAVFTSAGMMSPTSRCRTFDADADGYVRGEGVVVVVLKRLSDAQADGDCVHAVVRGSAVNQDGRSNGLTAPNGPAQEAVIRDALNLAGVEGGAIGYVEAHGTGTRLGDPIEMNSLMNVLGTGRSGGHRCAVGSVKTNIGHLEAAAGLAGVVKTVLALRHGAIPPSLHFVRANPQIKFKGAPFFVPTRLEEWSQVNGPRLAGVSAFGFGGTNAHVILEEAPVSRVSDPKISPERPTHAMVLSAKSETALTVLAGQMSAHLEAHSDVAFADYAFTANTGRSRLPYQLGLVASSNADAAKRLGKFADGGGPVRLELGRVSGGDRPVAFLFTGQGSQYAGMGRDLFESEPLFRRAMLEFDESFRRQTSKSLLETIYPDRSGAGSIDHTFYTQPAIFALECSLAQLWMSWGVRPAVVMGHSVGEYAAACVAGMFDCEEGMRLVAARARLMQSLPDIGAMRVVFAPSERVEGALAVYDGRVSVAAINGPANTVISGEAGAVASVAADLQRDGIGTRALNTARAFHSPLMQPMVDELLGVAREIEFRSPEIPIVSNVTGQMDTESMEDPLYWGTHVLAPVQFSAGLETLYGSGYRVFVELGPRPDLIRMGQVAIESDEKVRWIQSLDPDRDGWVSMLEAMVSCAVEGVHVDWQTFDHGRGRRRVTLPSYPFEGQRFWIDEVSEVDDVAGDPVHPLLGNRLPQTAHELEVHVWQSSISATRLPYLREHSILGAVVLPYAAFVEIALAAAAEVEPSRRHNVIDLRVQRPVSVPLLAGEVATLQTVMDRPAGDWRLRVYNRTGTSWGLVATGFVKPAEILP